MNSSKKLDSRQWLKWRSVGAVEGLNSAKRRGEGFQLKTFGDLEVIGEGVVFDVLLNDGRTTMSRTLTYRDPGIVSSYTDSGTVTRSSVRGARAGFTSDGFTIRLTSWKHFADNGAGSGVDAGRLKKPLDLFVPPAHANEVIRHLEELFAP